MTATDLSQPLQAQVQKALSDRQPVNIIGGNSKQFLGRTPEGDPLEVSGHRGVVNYEPQELILTARAGTPLLEIEQLLANHQQMLPFEPPHFGTTATLGGAIACGLSGPRRPYAGAARDFVLGCKIINGRGEILSFGGEVMKNVAGYDVSRLMTGAHGTLGVLLEISLKVLPCPMQSITLVQELSEKQALCLMNTRAGKYSPIDASCFDGNYLYTRLSGSPQAVSAAQLQLGGELLANDAHYWQQLREQQLAFFQHHTSTLWRISLPDTAPPLDIPGSCFTDWGGALRWLYSDLTDRQIRSRCERMGGQATRFRGRQHDTNVFHPLPASIFQLHQRIKNAFDPHGIFNRGRLYADL